jgi:hypothetical protein
MPPGGEGGGQELAALPTPDEPTEGKGFIISMVWGRHVPLASQNKLNLVEKRLRHQRRECSLDCFSSRQFPAYTPSINGCAQHFANGLNVKRVTFTRAQTQLGGVISDTDGGVPPSRDGFK